MKQTENEAGEGRDRIQTQRSLELYQGVEGGEKILRQQCSSQNVLARMKNVLEPKAHSWVPYLTGMDLHYSSFYPPPCSVTRWDSPWETWLLPQMWLWIQRTEGRTIRELHWQQQEIWAADLRSHTSHSFLLTSLCKYCPLEFCKAQPLDVSDS